MRSALKGQQTNTGTTIPALDYVALAAVGVAVLFFMVIAPPFTFWGIVGVVALLLRGYATKDVGYAKAAVGVMPLLVSYAVVNELVIKMTPHTIDAHLMRLDHGMGLSAVAWGNHHPICFWVLLQVYKMLAFPCILAIAFTAKRREAIFANIWAPILAFPIFLMFPAVGPIWVGTASPRNSVPSLHFAWALIAWWYSPRWLRWPLFVFAMLTGAATLVLGEHYLIDLVVALPFTATVCVLARLSARIVAKRSETILTASTVTP